MSLQGVVEDIDEAGVFPAVFLNSGAGFHQVHQGCCCIESSHDPHHEISILQMRWTFHTLLGR